MRRLRVLSTFVLVACFLVPSATAQEGASSGADLTKIDRSIKKEPAYQGEPKYCLLVFGPEAKTRIWLEKP